MTASAQQLPYAVTLSSLGFHVRDAAGTFVYAPDRGCRHLNNVPTFAARHNAEHVAADLNAEDS